MLDYDVKTSWR